MKKVLARKRRREDGVERRAAQQGQTSCSQRPSYCCSGFCQGPFTIRADSRGLTEAGCWSGVQAASDHTWGGGEETVSVGTRPARVSEAARGGGGILEDHLTSHHENPTVLRAT